MLSYSSNDLYINLFDNITDLTSYLSTKKRKPGRDNASESKDTSFTHTKSYEEAFDLLKYGDDELYKRFKKNRDKINIEKLLGNAVRKQKYENRIYGCVPNVPAYLLGHPLNMINPEIGRISYKVINIYISVGVCWSINASDIERTGLVYLSVIDLLEKAGYRCNVYCGASSIGSKAEYMYVRIKTDREPLNLKKLVFPLVHPSMLRRIWFRWAEVNDYDYDITGGYGREDSKEAIRRKLKKVEKEDFIFWGYENVTEEKHELKDIKKIIEELKKIGIDLKIGD